MPKTIETLVQDIHDLLMSDTVLDIPEELYTKYAERMVALMKNRVIDPPEHKPRLRISNIGRPCERQTWLEIHRPDKVEPLRPETRMKFLYGDKIEELLLFLAEAAGHKVEGVQDKITVEGVEGSRDAVIDGVLVDVKSTSTFSFKKFAEGRLSQDDPFGYVGQIQTYLEGCQDDPLVTDKDRCAFLVMDKTLGHICLDIHNKVPFDVKEITRHKVKVMSSTEMPDRGFEDEEDGKSGNRKLGLNCSYCSVKHECWPGLRTFIYGNGPRYLTKVVRTPDVLEVER